MRQDQIDKGDGDGREELKKQADHPVVAILGDTDPKPKNEH